MKHDDSISIMRVSAMLMIVFYHCLCYNAGVWSGFNNPVQYNPIAVAGIHNIACVGLDAFVFISGLLYYRISTTGKYDNNRSFLINKTKRLLIPYLVWGMLLCVIFWELQNPIRIFYGISHLWFLLMLFEVFVIVTFTKGFWNNLNIKKSCIVLTAIILFDGCVAKSGIIPRDSEGRVLLALQSTLDYLPIFYVGIIVEKFKLYNSLHINNSLIILIVIGLYIIGSMPFYIHLPLSRLYQWLPTCILIIITYYGINKSQWAKLGGVILPTF